MSTITPAELNKRLNADPSLAVIDVRTGVEYAQVHVAQARNIPLDTLDPQTLMAREELPRDYPFYVLCQSGKRATAAAEKFAKAGFANAVVIEGGTQGWVDAGLPVERSAVKIISLERQVRIGAGSLVLLGVLLGWLVTPYLYVLSGFVGCGLIFAGVTDWCGMGMLLAKAPWNKTTPKACCLRK